MDNIPTEVYRDIEKIVQDHLNDMHANVVNELEDGGFYSDENPALDAYITRLVRKLICENI